MGEETIIIEAAKILEGGKRETQKQQKSFIIIQWGREETYERGE